VGLRFQQDYSHDPEHTNRQIVRLFRCQRGKDNLLDHTYLRKLTKDRYFYFGDEQSE
jgi:hypothetical protein